MERVGCGSSAAARRELPQPAAGRRRATGDGRRVTLTATTAHRQALTDAMAPCSTAWTRSWPVSTSRIARWLTGTVSVMRDATLALAAENRDN
ncbi:hypothetical protein [Streptomyces koyangensis]|nr:hypothetical protein [Streptomyces koyangensis]